MFGFLRHWRYALLSIAAIAFFSLLTLKRADRPTVDCITIGKNDGKTAPYRLLVIGESWAAYGKLFPELPQTLSERMGGKPVEACSIAFSGRNTRLLYTELLDKLPKEKIYWDLYDRKTPDKLIVVNGVNDEIQHVGASAYVEYTKKLVDYFNDIEDVELISVPRVNEKKFKSPNIFSAVKRAIFRCLHDGCEYQANEKYRVALWRDHPELQVIEFDNFMEKYEGNEYRFKPDGVHLTDEELHKYGAFIGRSASLRYLPMTMR